MSAQTLKSLLAKTEIMIGSLDKGLIDVPRIRAYLEERADSLSKEIESVVEAVTACPSLGNCALCENTLTYDNVNAKQPNYCSICDEGEMKSVMDDYPEDAKEAMRNSMYGQGAFHALFLRIQANNCREAADDTDDAQEARDCLKEAERLDARASELLYTKADYTFKPWWYARWDYFRVPGSTHEVPTWAPKDPGYTEEPPVSEWPARRAESEEWVQLWAKAAAAGIPSPPHPSAQPTKPEYNHRNWPSPRAKLFANELIKAANPLGDVKNIRKHEHALLYLAERADLTVEQLLKMNLAEYVAKYNGGRAPAFYKRRY